MSNQPTIYCNSYVHVYGNIKILHIRIFWSDVCVFKGKPPADGQWKMWELYWHMPIKIIIIIIIIIILVTSLFT
jgi:hypothetical protein